MFKKLSNNISPHSKESGDGFRWKRVGFFVTKLHSNHLCDFRSIYRPRTCLLASISSLLSLLNFSNEYTFYCKWLRIPHLMIFQLILFSILCKRKLHLQSKQNRVGNPQRVRHLGNFGLGKLNILMNLNRSRQFWALLKSSFSHWFYKELRFSMWYKDDVFKVRFLEVYAFEVCVFVVCVFEVCVFEVCVFEVCVLEVCSLWSAFSRSAFSRHPPKRYD